MTEYGLQIGSTVEVILLSLGLADRINTIKKEQLMTQQMALKSNQDKVAAQQLAVENLQRVSILKDQFLANTSHELRTPLHGIIGITESILQGATGGVNDATQDNLRMVSASGRRLANLVNDIMDFSQLQHGDILLRCQGVGVSSLIEIVLALSRPLLGDKDLDLVHEKNDLPLVYADEDRLTQILQNLVGNAIKFTKSGSVRLLGRVVSDDFVEIKIADTGIGIPLDKQTIIFESFTQADGSISREYSGTGIGLSVTKKLVELHGGEIRVESTPGKGSQFIFTLPNRSW